MRNAFACVMTFALSNGMFGFLEFALKYLNGDVFVY